MKKLLRHQFLFYAVVCFGIELFFVFGITNTFLRSYATDVFAVMYVYFLLRYVKLSVMQALALTFVVAYVIECIQLFEIFKGTENIFVTLVVGGTYDFYDLLAYNVGLGSCLLMEHNIIKNPDMN